MFFYHGKQCSAFALIVQEQFKLIAFFGICDQSADKENPSEIHAESVIARTVRHRVSIAFIRKSNRVKCSSSEGACTGRIFLADQVKGIGNAIGYPFVFRIKKTAFAVFRHGIRRSF